MSLILSDVIDDSLDTIASGPTVPDYSTPEQCFQIFEKLRITNKVPESVIEVLKEKRYVY